MLNILTQSQNEALVVNLPDYWEGEASGADPGCFIRIVASDLEWYLGPACAVNWPRGWKELAIAIRNVYAAENRSKTGYKNLDRPLHNARRTVQYAFKSRYRLRYR